MSEKTTALAKAREAKKAKNEARKKAVQAAREVAKAAAEAEERKTAEEMKQVNHDLELKAREVDERIRLAARDEDKAWDHRQAAALVLADAQKVCEEHSINFKKWCADNIKEQSYETIRKLAAAGRGGERKVKAAIADMRARNALANKKLRARKREEKKGAAPVKRVDLVASATAALDQLTDKKQFNLMSERAKKLGFAVVPSELANKPAASPSATLEINDLKEGFKKLNPSARLAFTKWACEEVGGKYSDATTFVPSGDDVADMKRIREGKLDG